MPLHELWGIAISLFIECGDPVSHSRRKEGFKFNAYLSLATKTNWTIGLKGVMIAMQQKTPRFLQAIDSISEVTGRLVSYLIIFVFGLVVCDVILRYAFNAPTVWANELATYIYGGFSAIGGAYTLRQGGHVRVDVLYNLLSPRRKAMINVFTAAGFFLFVVVLVWLGGSRALSATLIFEHSGSFPFNPPIWPFLWVLPIGAGLMGLQGLAGFFRDIFFAIKGRELQ
jgi:TRAP-type mannitol/chloroaromatic compound transport system permease small subunit